MSNIAIKLGVGVASAGAVGGIGYGVHAYNSTTDTVKNYLTNNKFELRADNWEIVLATYKVEKTKDTEIQDAEVIDANVIKTWCETNLKQNIKSTEDPLFKKASKWCIKFDVISSKFGSKKLVSEVATLDNKLRDFDDEIQKEINKIEIKEQPETNKVGKQIKKWCEDNSKRRYSNDNDLYYKEIMKGCLTG